MQKRLEAEITGNVQGVFFRSTAKEHADHLGLVGYAKNQPDGSVHVIAEGENEKLEDFLAFLRDGPPMAEVRDVNAVWTAPSGSFEAFEIG